MIDAGTLLDAIAPMVGALLGLITIIVVVLTMIRAATRVRKLGFLVPVGVSLLVIAIAVVLPEVTGWKGTKTAHFLTEIRIALFGLAILIASFVERQLMSSKLAPPAARGENER